AQTQSFYRLFLIPGMGHCGGAYGVDWITALEQWVEGGQAPDQVMGKRLPPARFGPPVPAATAQTADLGSRPICAYPREAAYRGSGSAGDPQSFSCRMGPTGPRAADHP
ncbi:MAG TPA: tannase/feruloyl esterase family alpha/beta hydrolase, partial [Caulobacteraceae bacterium]|nr:tannase/feruloyl esterase family alpha/beta hydrolase [Caulobacteraceae bacterium]